MSATGDNSYLITGKVCPPKLPMQKIAPEGWSSLTPSLIDSLFNEVSVQGRQTNTSNSLCALSFQASVWLSTDGLSASSVGGLPYFLCNFCDYHTDSKAKLLQHVVCRHVFRCKLCDFVSFSLHELVQHQLHKHLDAEEMQPVLNSKMVLMNFPLFQRNLHIFSQCDSISHTSKSSDGRPAESEVANSSVISISKVCPTGHHYNQSQLENDQFEHTYVKYESPVTSSKDNTQYVDADIGEDNGAFSKPHWNIQNDSSKTGSLSKRSYSQEGSTDCELSPKRFRKTCNENSEASDDLFDQSQSHPSQMPHFLDDSDSYVTSSCSPHKNTSPVVLEMRQEQSSLGKNQGEAEETYSADQVLSFFMEPSSSVVSRHFEKSDARDNENSASEFNPLLKSSPLYGEFYCESVSKEPDGHLSRVHKKLLGCSRRDLFIRPGSNEADSKEADKSQHPQLSMLSRPDLKEQPEKETSERSLGPLLESCTSILEILQHRNYLLQPRSSASHKTELSVGNPDGVPDKSCRRRQAYCQDVNSDDVENFLLLPGNSCDIVTTKENTSSVDGGNDTTEFYAKHRDSENDETHLSVREKESYDLLRRLLLGTANRKSLPDIATTTSKDKQAEFPTGKDVYAFQFTKTNEENSRYQSCAPVVTRASDMSLRDLLTQGLGSIHHSLFFECNNCHFKSNNKAEFQKHIKICELRCAQNKTKTMEIITKLEREDVIPAKTEAPPSNCKSLDSDYTSETFVASELLKGLSEHYSESLGSDVSLYDKSHELNSDSQLYVCDKSHKVKNESPLYVCDNSYTLQSENQVSVHDKSCVSKSLSQIYSFNKSHALKSHIEMNSCDKSQMLNKDTQIGTFLSQDQPEGLGKKHISTEIGTDSRKQVIKKCGQNEGQEWGYYSEAPDGFCNISSGDEPAISIVKTEEKNELCVPLKKKHDLNMEEGSLCRVQNVVSDRQQKPQYTCMYCDFVSNDILYVRQHLFGSHPTNASFFEVLIPTKGKTLLYLCRGVQSTCTFMSSESTEIFKHIKLCYFGCLDNFIDSDDQISPDYSHVLFCLGQASGFINTPTAMFYCLRCSYYVPEFQQIADHVSDNHASLVAGVLSVNRSFIEPRIRMVCLVCKAHINVKLWLFHHCRKRFKSDCSRQAVSDSGSRDPCATKLESILRLSDLTGNQPLSYGSSNSIDSPSLASESGLRDFSDQENYKSQMKINRQSISSTDKVNNQNNASKTTCILRKPFNENSLTEESVGIKQEVPDVAMQELYNDDLTVHFQQQFEVDDHGTAWIPYSDIESNHMSQTVRMTNSPQTCSRKLTSGPSVLHSLLTASGNVELNQQSFSSLHKLLQPDLAAEEKRPPKTISALHGDFMSAAADLHSQYPCILEILKRQESASQENVAAESPPLLSPDKGQQEESRDFVTRRPSSILLSALCHPHILSEQIQSAASTCLPKLDLLLPSEAPDKGSLPHTSTSLNPESRDTAGPFTNLLQLLCKSKKSGP